MEAPFFSAYGGTVLNLGRQSEVEEKAKEKAEWVYHKAAIHYSPRTCPWRRAVCRGRSGAQGGEYP